MTSEPVKPWNAKESENTWREQRGCVLKIVEVKVITRPNKQQSRICTWWRQNYLDHQRCNSFQRELAGGLRFRAVNLIFRCQPARNVAHAFCINNAGLRTHLLVISSKHVHHVTHVSHSWRSIASIGFLCGELRASRSSVLSICSWQEFSLFLLWPSALCSFLISLFTNFRRLCPFSSDRSLAHSCPLPPFSSFPSFPSLLLTPFLF